MINPSASENTTPETNTVPEPQKNEAQSQQDIIQKLLQDKQSSAHKTTKIDALKSGQNRSLSDREVKKMRYKVYSLVLLVLSVIVWISFVQPLISDYVSTNEKIDTLTQKLKNTQTSVKTATKKQTFANTITKNTTDLIACVNTSSSCEDATAKLLPYEKNAQSAIQKAQKYLQIGDLSDPKLLIDEKSILTNIDLFLLRSNKNNRIGSSFGDVQKLTISDPKNQENNMYSVDIEAVIRFRIITNERIHLPPILYTIQEVQYDIAKYTEAQDTTIKLTAYYYKGDKKTATTKKETTPKKEK